MIGCYTIRKLLDALAIHASFESHQVQVVSFPSNGKKLSRMVWPTVSEHYDLSQPASKTLSAKDFCNTMVHSCVFSLWFSPQSRFEGVFFSSDWKKAQVYRIPAGEIARLFTEVARSYYPMTLRFAPYTNKEVM